jgi:hypothetical protein
MPKKSFDVIDNPRVRGNCVAGVLFAKDLDPVPAVRINRLSLFCLYSDAEAHTGCDFY